MSSCSFFTPFSMSSNWMADSARKPIYSGRQQSMHDSQVQLCPHATVGHSHTDTHKYVSTYSLAAKHKPACCGQPTFTVMENKQAIATAFSCAMDSISLYAPHRLSQEDCDPVHATGDDAGSTAAEALALISMKGIQHRTTDARKRGTVSTRIG